MGRGNRKARRSKESTKVGALKKASSPPETSGMVDSDQAHRNVRYAPNAARRPLQALAVPSNWWNALVALSSAGSGVTAYIALADAHRIQAVIFAIVALVLLIGLATSFVAHVAKRLTLRLNVAIRLFWMVGAVVAIAAGGKVLLGHFGSEPIRLAVAPLEGPDGDRGYRIRGNIIDGFMEAKQVIDHAEVCRTKFRIVVVATGRSPLTRDDAEKLRAEESADVLVWGSYGATKKAAQISVRAQFRQGSQGTQEIQEATRASTTVHEIPIDSLETFAFQENRRNEATAVALFLMSDHAASTGDQKCARLLNALVASYLPTDEPALMALRMARTAIGHLRNGNPGSAYVNARMATQLNPRSSLGWKVLGKALSQFSRNRCAARAFETALQIEGGEGGRPGSTTWDLLEQYGLVGDLDRAGNLLDSYGQLLPSPVATQCNTINFLTGINEYKLALRYQQACVDAGWSSGDERGGLGQTLLLMKRYREAYALFVRGSRGRNSAGAVATLLAGGQWEDAKIHLLEVARGEEDPGWSAEISSLLRGSKHYDAARHFLRWLKERYPGFYALDVEDGVLAQLQGRHVEARAILGEVVLLPTEIQSNVIIALAFSCAGTIKEETSNGPCPELAKVPRSAIRDALSVAVNGKAAPRALHVLLRASRGAPPTSPFDGIVEAVAESCESINDRSPGCRRAVIAACKAGQGGRKGLRAGEAQLVRVAIGDYAECRAAMNTVLPHPVPNIEFLGFPYEDECTEGFPEGVTKPGELKRIPGFGLQMDFVPSTR